MIKKLKYNWFALVSAVSSAAYKLAWLLLGWYYVTDEVRYHQFNSHAVRAFYDVLSGYFAKMQGL